MRPTPRGMSVVQAQTGHKSDITVYRKGRKCKLPSCRKLLNSYTEGPYCLAHEFKGAVIEMDKELAAEDAKATKARRDKAREFRMKREARKK